MVTATKEKQIELLQTLACMVLVSIPVDGIPSGHVYAKLCGNIGLDEYNAILGELKRGESVIEKSHYLERGPNYQKLTDLLKRKLLA